MINGAHFLLYSKNPDADQEALRAVLGSMAVPAEPGRLILALPPSEIATHPGPDDFTQSHAGRDLLGIIVYLMCDDLARAVQTLNAKKIRCTEIEDTEFGLKTTILLPSGGEIGLYQPSHQTAVHRARDEPAAPLSRSAEQELIAVAHEWDRAMVENDAEGIGRYMADDWTIIGPDGSVADKATFLGLVKSGALTHDVVESEDFQVRVYGNTAVVIARGVSGGTYQGQAFREVERASCVFVKQEGRWQCVSTHLSRLARH